MKLDTLFLKCALFVLGIPVFAMSFGMSFEVFKSYERHPEYVVLQILVLLGTYTAAGAYYFILFQAYKLLVYIDGEKVFSNLSMFALKKIRVGAITISTFFILLLPLVFLAEGYDDAPGLIKVGIVFMFASITVAVFSYVLQKIVQSVIDINVKDELRL